MNMNEDNKIKINIKEDSDTKDLLLPSEDTIIPDQNTTNEYEKDNVIKKEPNIFKQFLIRKVYLIAISAFSILLLLHPFIVLPNDYLYEEFFIFAKQKKINKFIYAIFNDKQTEMNVEESKKLMYDFVTFPIIYYCFISPFVEEYLFRWFIFGFIKYYGQKIKKNNKLVGNLVIAFAFIFSSVLYSFVHFKINGDNLKLEVIYLRGYFNVTYFILGNILAWIYSRYGYILIVILMQMLYNIVDTVYATSIFASDCYDGCALRKFQN
ncbi:hypothetical protein PIROE2DRAFT_15364 [Piromyces sp. E2]|nr:hypothetical protein PIROE2DRAFT_15364 [Piromyces sp. E2]|eukprot:OUM59169.1 hypothetical protein PIROE2DRAFT_15364 [Piromyces sp. E2]